MAIKLFHVQPTDVFVKNMVNHTRNQLFNKTIINDESIILILSEIQEEIGWSTSSIDKITIKALGQSTLLNIELSFSSESTDVEKFTYIDTGMYNEKVAIVSIDDIIYRVIKYTPDGDKFVEITYHSNGKAASKKNYDCGRSHGTWTYWHNNEVVAQEKHFVMGKLEGFYFKQSKTRMPIEEGYYKNGKKEGLWKSYQSGIIAWEAIFHNNELHGEKTIFLHPGGRIVAEYQKGLLSGVETIYSSKDIKQCQRTYKDGMQHGLELFWYDNGSLRAHNEYREGRKIGKGHHWTPDGKEWMILLYDNDGQRTCGCLLEAKKNWIDKKETWRIDQYNSRGETISKTFVTKIPNEFLD